MQTPEMHAEELLRKFCNLDGSLEQKLPIDPFDVALKVGLSVKPFPEVGSDFSGELFPSKKWLFFNSTDSVHRQRFVVAQELGHFVLGHPYHHRLPKETPLYAIYDLDEKKALKFAYELLMPKAIVKTVISQKKIKSSDKLAEIFKVPLQTFEARLKDLGLTVGKTTNKRIKKKQALFDYLGNEALPSAS
ncbi:MAG: ImmA/IrrE family metallo-endopeptidase [Burkholderiales bacterium]|nr:ImmA/IrrE family metallo-endopeptidase [Burkholderiales bacterium]